MTRICRWGCSSHGPDWGLCTKRGPARTPHTRTAVWKVKSITPYVLKRLLSFYLKVGMVDYLGDTDGWVHACYLTASLAKVLRESMGEIHTNTNVKSTSNQL